MPIPRKSHPRPGPFVPVPSRARADGWTPQTQARFLGLLAQTQSVAAAARGVGMTRQTAYRLRRRAHAESFAAAWDRAPGRGQAEERKVTPFELARRALGGLVWPVVHRGRFRHVAHKQDNSALLRLLARLDRVTRGAPDGPDITDKKAPFGGPRSPRLTPAALAPNPPRVCGAEPLRSGPPHAPSPVEPKATAGQRRMRTTCQAEGLYPWPT